VAVDLAVCFSTEVEGALLRKSLEQHEGAVAVIQTGVGAVNAAHAVTLFLAQERANAIVICGVAGAYPASGLRLGDVVCAESECYGDLGATSPEGFLGMKQLGLPVVEGLTPLYNTFPMQAFPAPRRAMFVTVTTLTGTDAGAGEMEKRTGGAVENMEGAAIAHVAHMHGVPVGELRGISNMVGDRDLRKWRLEEAALAAQEALVAWIRSR